MAAKVVVWTPVLFSDRRPASALHSCVTFKLLAFIFASSFGYWCQWTLCFSSSAQRQLRLCLSQFDWTVRFLSDVRGSIQEQKGFEGKYLLPFLTERCGMRKCFSDWQTAIACHYKGLTTIGRGVLVGGFSGGVPKKWGCHGKLSNNLVSNFEKERTAAKMDALAQIYELSSFRNLGFLVERMLQAKSRLPASSQVVFWEFYRKSEIRLIYPWIRFCNYLSDNGCQQCLQSLWLDWCDLKAIFTLWLEVLWKKLITRINGRELFLGFCRNVLEWKVEKPTYRKKKKKKNGSESKNASCPEIMFCFSFLCLSVSVCFFFASCVCVWCDVCVFMWVCVCDLKRELCAADGDVCIVQCATSRAAGNHFRCRCQLSRVDLTSVRKKSGNLVCICITLEQVTIVS